MKKIAFLLFVSVQALLFAQELKVKDPFTVVVREEVGDLNRDGFDDETVISMDTANADEPLKLDIFFGDAKGKLKLQFSSSKIMENQYSNGKYLGNHIPYFMIEDGFLVMISEKDSVHFIHKFLYKNGKFELQNYDSVHYNGDSIKETFFNLISGEKTDVLTEFVGSNNEEKKIEKKLLIRPLPTLENFRSLEHRWK